MASKERQRDRDAEIMGGKVFGWVSADLARQARSGDVNDITAVDSRLQSDDDDDFACVCVYRKWADPMPGLDLSMKTEAIIDERKSRFQNSG